MLAAFTGRPGSGLPLRSITTKAIAPRELFGSNTGALTSVSLRTGRVPLRKSVITLVVTFL